MRHKAPGPPQPTLAAAPGRGRWRPTAQGGSLTGAAGGGGVSGLSASRVQRSDVSTTRAGLPRDPTSGPTLDTASRSTPRHKGSQGRAVLLGVVPVPLHVPAHKVHVH